MLNIKDLLYRLGKGEDVDLEFKSAKGGLPRSLWETYSAMANTVGGIIVIGVRDDGVVEGLTNINKLRKSLWDTLNNPGKISRNLFTEEDVLVSKTERGPILVLSVRRASRKERPVYVGQNPLMGTYRRNYEGDYRCTEQEVGRMFADQASESKDSLILPEFTIEKDLDLVSLRQYRQRFSARSPVHPWLSEDELGLLRKLGGWRKDRKSLTEGLTLEGLLMFGREESILEALPQYHLDFREKDSSDSTTRWSDRLTLDGTWEGNLFQFYLKVYQRLSVNLKLPFQLDSNLIRRGESPIHVAIREALVNALIHADYHGEGGIVIEQHHDGFVLSNPGTLLLSIEQILEGGVSECRNKVLQRMFYMIGAAEKAGSGVDKILQGWASQHWRSPHFDEKTRPDRVQVHLPTVSTIPRESLLRLQNQFGPEIQELGEIEISALVTADLEGFVSNGRMRQICRRHPSDLTIILQGLVASGFLKQEGRGRWTTYRLPDKMPENLIGSKENLIGSEGDLVGSQGDLMDSLTNPTESESHEEGRAVWREIPPETVNKLKALAIEGQERIAAKDLTRLVLKLCAEEYLTKAQLGLLLNRNPDYIYHSYLRPLVEQEKLELKYPSSRSRPGQAYKTVKSSLVE